MNTKQIWQAALGDLQVQIPRNEFDTWIKQTSLIAVEDQLAIVGATNIFVRQELEGRYVSSITDTLSSILGYPVQVQVVIGNHNDNGSAEEDVPRPSTNGNGTRPTAQQRPATELTQLELPTPRTAMLHPRLTFDSFIVGSSNRLAHAACLAVAEHPAHGL